jgi:hypothetical protein
MIRRTGLGLLVALALAVTGCASGEGGNPDLGGPSSGQQADPKLALVGSTDALNQESFKMEMSMGDLMSASGAMDPAAGTGSVSMSIEAEGMAMDIETIFTETDGWISLGEMGALLGVQTEWMHVDQTRLPEGGFMGVQPGDTDPANTAELLQGLGTVRQVDEHSFEGEIDVTQGRSDLLDEEMVAAMGEDATTLPFTATIDDQGRLTSMVIDFPAMPEFPAQSMEIRYFDFGTPVEITPPAADQVSEMPAEFYQMFQG